jgi:hypothetical protein
MIETNYCPNWQKARINFILSKYSEEFFKGKRILELGAFNGYIGAYFSNLGAIVHSVEGRAENAISIQNNYPKLEVSCYDLDTNIWEFGHYDIIINFGLYYHLEKFHKEHLVNCINNCDLMFFETVVYDSFESEIHFRHEVGKDQSLSDTGGNPSTSYIENIFKELNTPYTKYTNASLNGDGHHYDWKDLNSKILDPGARRFWIVKD